MEGEQPLSLLLRSVTFEVNVSTQGFSLKVLTTLIFGYRKSNRNSAMIADKKNYATHVKSQDDAIPFGSVTRSYKAIRESLDAWRRG